MSLIKIKQIEGLQTALDSINAHLASGSLKSDYTAAYETLRQFKDEMFPIKFDLLK